MEIAADLKYKLILLIEHVENVDSFELLDRLMHRARGDTSGKRQAVLYSGRRYQLEGADLVLATCQ